MLSHNNLASNALTLIDLWGFRETDVLLHALPIYHVHGLFVAVHCAMLCGISMRFLERFDPDEVMRQLPADYGHDGCTHVLHPASANVGFQSRQLRAHAFVHQWISAVARTNLARLF